MQFFKLIITHPVLKASDGIFYEHPKKLSIFSLLQNYYLCFSSKTLKKR